MRLNLHKTKSGQIGTVELPNDGQRNINKPPQVEYDDRLVFKFNARFRIKARDIEPIQKSLLEWAKKWQLDL